MKYKHPLPYRILSLVLSFAVVLPSTLALIGDSGSAQAITSLPFVEELKQNSSTFNILEIVPNVGEGSIGYYIDGQEPCANWPQVAAKEKSPGDRKTYVDKLFANLTSAGLLGAIGTATAPLTKVADYSEAYPWQSHSGYTKMTLPTPDTTSANGTFTPVTDATGGFTQNSTLTIAANGTHVQVIDYFSTDDTKQTALNGPKFYYNPTFVPFVPTDNTTLPFTTTTKTAVYTREVNGDYTYFGTVGAIDFPGFEIGDTYYYVSASNAPLENNTTNKYVAVSSSSRPKHYDETGYFNVTNIKYTYVGTGGTYNFVAGGTTSNDIICNTVYYTGGYTNNNWFLRYVLDWSPENGEAKPGITFKVKSVVANDSNLTADQVDWATLVVLSNGFVPGGTATAYSGTIDISDAVSSAITAAVVKSGSTDTNFNLPVIVDNRLLSSSAPKLKALATSLKPSTATFDSFVSGSVFFFSPELATKDFRTFYGSSSYSVSGSAFYAAYQEIVYENFLRTTANASAVTLEEKVNMARAVRYIINFAGKRVITPKTTVNVLEIQPGSGNKLTASLVKTWLGYASDSTAITVNINTMSTAELIGKIDVISEKYDFVYVGAEVQGFNPSNTNSTDFNDSNLDGLIYSNIGDTVVMNSGDYTMSGLLDRDYSTTSPATFSFNGITYQKLLRTNLSRTFRYSGNDLTNTKMQEIQDFLNSGYPVIVSDNLTSGNRHPATEQLTISASIACVQNDNTGAVLQATATAAGGKAIPSYYTPTYKWYRLGSSTPFSGETLATYKAVSAGTYYCTISYTVNGTTYSPPATSNQLVLTQKTGYKYTEIVNGSSGTYQTITDYALTLSRASNTYSVTVSPTKDGITYQWEGRNGNSSWSDINGVTASNTLTNNTYNRYRCEVIIDGVRGTYTSQLKNSDANISNDVRINTSVLFNAIVTPSINSDGVALTCNDIPDIGVTAFQWYYVNTYGGYSTYLAGSSISPVTSGTYYCKATKGSSSANSNDYTISSSVIGYNTANGSAGTSVTIPAQAATSFTINGSTVDNSSYMYALLDTNKSKANFIAESELAVTENKDKLKQFVNLSKPEIVFSTNAPNNEPFPTEYSNNNGTVTSLSAKSDGSYYLEYYFSVINNTDTNPVNTRYTCNLYVDANGDGRYSDAERLTDSVVREWDSTTNTIGAIVNSSELKAGSKYYASRRMPSDKYGIVPWKLEIVMSGTGNSGTYTSVHKYTHIPTETDKRVSLDILQINASGGLSLADQTREVGSSGYYSSVTNKYYNGIYGKLLADVSRDFNVSITTILTDGVNSMPSGGWMHGTTSYTNLLDYLKSYEMLIIGFKDTYGDLVQASAQAITAYIGTGKAILFTHDNTSFYNLPFSGYQTNTSSTVSSGWGYYFNMTIRDAVGLDRYGVTNSKYGISTYAPPPIKTNRTSDWNGWVAKGYSGTTAANQSELTTAGYSLAYQPKSSRGTMVWETQGFTRGVLNRYKGSSDNFQTTSLVSQVNEGQITTYPYNVNTSGFLNNVSTSNSMIVATTHFQYYQLNMNSKDTVVWYCLKYSDKTLGLDNDAANSYYIYSKGNVTYSGAGHTTDSGSVNSNIEEAKLFVNTMIAAYRITLVPPEVKFSDATGNNVLKYCLIPSDSDGVLAPVKSTDPARNIYFTVNDTNIGKNKVVSAAFYAGPVSEDNKIDLPIYNPQTKLAVTANDSLISGIPYYVKLDDVLLLLPQTVKDNISAGTAMPISIAVTTSINGVTMSNASTLMLQKLMLFNLS